jgi:CheY-like chemotaxis protein/HPt (histidine-containing phosphotransfer) domain-containing protein
LIRGDRELDATRCAMLTSAALRGDAERLRQIGFDAYLTKPLKQDHVRRCVAALRGAAAGPATPANGGMITRYTLEDAYRTEVRILLVEDNPTNQKVACGMLGKRKFLVDIAPNGQEALTALSQQRYDLVLMDCQMPVMDGFEATRSIRAGAVEGIDRSLPIIAMTAGAMQGDRERCLAAGMDDYIAKPVVEARLFEAIDRALGLSMEAGSPAAEQAHAGNGSAVFDRDAVLAPLGGDREIAIILIDGLIADLPGALDALEHSLGAGDAETAERHAHTIKGLAAGGGASQLRDAARRIEQLCRDGVLDEALRRLPELRACLGQVMPEWRQYSLTETGRT